MRSTRSASDPRRSRSSRAGELLAVDRDRAVADLDDGDTGVGLPWNQGDAVLQGDDVVAFAQAAAKLGDVAGRLRAKRGHEYRGQHDGQGDANLRPGFPHRVSRPPAAHFFASLERVVRTSSRVNRCST